MSLSHGDDAIVRADAEHLREAEEMLAQHSSSSAAPPPLAAPSARGSSSPPVADSRSDAHNPVAQRVLHMARTLGIDASREFYLLPLAAHALEAPSRDWSSAAAAGGESAEQAEAELDWFRALVDAERQRCRHAPGSNSPWVQLREATDGLDAAGTAAAASLPAAAAGVFAHPASAPSAAQAAHASEAGAAAARSTGGGSSAGRTFWYNFQTFRSAPSLPSARVASSVPPARVDAANELDVMRFTSWFSDGGVRRYVYVAYVLSADEFEVRIDSGRAQLQLQQAKAAVEQKVFRIKSIQTKHGSASCWDLHLKATLNILGRPTTLMQCDSSTRLWLETNARRLLKVRSVLESQLSKYESVAPAPRPPGPLVECHLRAIMKDVARLKNKLASYRPSLADKYAL